MVDHDRAQLVWRACACPFRRAGVYFGLATGRSQFLVARWLLPRRGRSRKGAIIALRAGRDPVPLNYHAIRDPSAVAVIPLRPARRHREGEPRLDALARVRLAFSTTRDARPPIPAATLDEREFLDLAHLATESERRLFGAFIVTVGLRIDLEPEFYRRAALEPPVAHYADLCDRIYSLRETFAS